MALVDRLRFLFDFWEKRTKLERFVILGGTLLVFVGLLFLSLFAGKRDYAVLYSNLNLEDAGEITKVLREKSVPYKLENDGKTILVPKELVHEVRIEVASRGLPRSSVGFEIFDKTRFGVTEFSEHLQYIRALQGELERTISSLNQVESVRVHLAIPKESVFLREKEEPKATVVVKLKPGMDLGPSEVKAIVHLVSGAVGGLKPYNVTVVDTSGRDLTELIRTDNALGAAGDRIEFKHKLEKAFEKKVNDLLVSILGPGRAVAKVTLDVDFSKIERLQESFDPEGVAVRSEDITNETSRGIIPSPGGVPGVESNIGPPEPIVAQANSSYDKARMIRNYEVSKIVEKTEIPPGIIKRVSVSVMVDGLYEKSGDKEVYKPLPQQDLDAIKRAVMASIGYNPERGDLVEVVNVQFRNDELKSYREEIKKMEERAFIYSLVKYGTFFVFLMVFLFLVIRPLVRYLLERGKVPVGEVGEGVTEIQTPRAPISQEPPERMYMEIAKLLEEKEVSVDEVAKEVFGEEVLEGLKTEKAKAKAMLKQVKEWVDKNPQSAAKLIESWIEEVM